MNNFNKLKNISAQGFSLIEVVVALGIMSFALVTLIGPFSVGLQTSKESVEAMQAANLASRLIAERRAAPESKTMEGAGITNLDQEDNFKSNTSYFSRNGAPLGSDSNAGYRLNYRITVDFDGDGNPDDSRVPELYVSVEWPARGDVKGRYEILTYVALP
ncbi:MAG: type II secretion system protein [Blastochloris sp.]|nr:type II secretion system protein [Blastochloris sp.]